MHPRDSVDAMVDEWRAQVPSAATMELEIVKRVARLAGRIASTTDAVLSPHGMTYADFEVLVILRRAGLGAELSAGQIAARSSLTTGGIANILKRLELLALIERRRDEVDARVTRVSATAAGSELAELLAVETSRAHRELFGAVPPEDLTALAAQLRSVLVALGDTAH
jgi:DNA-binding MarR family transcriptional regulator